ncbi:glycosyltransferase family 2 protein [Aestuariivivens insulae]|uniref:glycosyltransferase family 2 protein n=1 Tax=Aestuariivivens insulae TaxID=1621988 RepID=UPI001F5ACB7D|nr:glycosyltransferase family 2 protein [Aestuariivivens insulae]
MPFFSVIIPLYNKEDYIADTLNSVLNQSFQDFEVIIVNDGSTDGSLDVVSGFEDHRIIVLNQDNLGLSAARNNGIKISSGLVIALLDADDIWLTYYLSSIKHLHDTFPKAAIYGTDYIEKYSDKHKFEPSKNISRRLKNKSFIIDDFFLANLNHPIVCPSSMCFKKSSFNNHEIFDVAITYAEDVAFYLEYCPNMKVAYSYKALIEKNCDVPGQMTRTNISTKRLPNLDDYEFQAKSNLSLKKYLDQYRYVFSHLYKLEGNRKQAKEVLKNIDYGNLSIKQLFLLKIPRVITVLLNKVKLILLKINIRVST